jgi:hypothetical protein
LVGLSVRARRAAFAAAIALLVAGGARANATFGQRLAMSAAAQVGVSGAP